MDSGKPESKWENGILNDTAVFLSHETLLLHPLWFARTYTESLAPEGCIVPRLCHGESLRNIFPSRRAYELGQLRC